MSLEDTLADRGKTHGSFAENAHISQIIKGFMRQAPNWGRLTQVQKEALEVIAAKVSRILSGNPNEPDHWHDIQGYARLAEQVLLTEQPRPFGSEASMSYAEAADAIRRRGAGSIIQTKGFTEAMTVAEATNRLIRDENEGRTPEMGN